MNAGRKGVFDIACGLCGTGYIFSIPFPSLQLSIAHVFQWLIHISTEPITITTGYI